MKAIIVITVYASLCVWMQLPVAATPLSMASEIQLGRAHPDGSSANTIALRPPRVTQGVPNLIPDSVPSNPNNPYDVSSGTSYDTSSESSDSSCTPVDDSSNESDRSSSSNGDGNNNNLLTTLTADIETGVSGITHAVKNIVQAIGNTAFCFVRDILWAVTRSVRQALKPYRSVFRFIMGILNIILPSPIKAVINTPVQAITGRKVFKRSIADWRDELISSVPIVGVYLKRLMPCLTPNDEEGCRQALAPFSSYVTTVENLVSNVALAVQTMMSMEPNEWPEAILINLLSWLDANSSGLEEHGFLSPEWADRLHFVNNILKIFMPII